jgi:enoyl-CoA hydratase
VTEGQDGPVRVVREDDGVALVFLHHPPVNALSRAVLGALNDAVAGLEKDPTLRAVVVASDVPQFSAGADLKELAGLDPADAPALVREGQAVFERIARLPVPTIAAVHGFAVGGGFELALACDLRITDDSGKFGAPEVQHGLVPAWGGTQRLARLLGPSKAGELAFTGTLVSAAEASRIGLVNKVVPSGQELRAARDVAHTIGERAPRAVRAVKQAIREGIGRPMAEALAIETELVVREILPSRDLAEGLKAFTERRPARFTGE